MINEKIKTQLKEDLKQCQYRCSARIYSLEDIEKMLEDNKKLIEDLIKLKLNITLITQEGDYTSSWGVKEGTKVTINFNKSAKVKDIEVVRKKNSSSFSRIYLNNFKDLTELERKLLRKQFNFINVNNDMYINI